MSSHTQHSQMSSAAVCIFLRITLHPSIPPFHPAEAICSPSERDRDTSGALTSNIPAGAMIGRISIVTSVQLKLPVTLLTAISFMQIQAYVCVCVFLFVYCIVFIL